VRGRAEITNLPWILDESKLQNELDLEKVTLINDLVAVASSVPHLYDHELRVLQDAPREPGGTLAVIAPGTGLGEAFLTWDGEKYLAYGSEGGHTDFAPTNALESGLLRALQERFGHVSYERVCSGMGLPNIYHYLKSVGYADEPPWLAEQLTQSADPNPVILEAAMDTERPSDLCRTTMEVFVSILGAEAGNLALKVLATGGVFLGGGIPPRILPFLESAHFIESFKRKGRFGDLLAGVPVYVIMNPKVALLGAAFHVLGGAFVPGSDPTN
jgi:glucokinase